jgi:hypothetical protein
MAVVIYNQEDGVFLGSFIGLSFWSKLDPVGQPSAPTFPDAESAKAYVATWDHQPELQFVEVEVDDGNSASVASCVRAGLPGWLDADTPVVNGLPA